MSHSAATSTRYIANAAARRALRQRRARAWRAALFVALVCVSLAPKAARAAADDARREAHSTADSVPARLGFAESLFRAGDDFRAESEMLAFLIEAPGHPLRPEVELARAKLHYRAGRLADADVMLLSLLDRKPRSPVAEDARRLLGFSWLRQGRLGEAQPLLAGEPDLAALLESPPYRVDHAVAWSTALPGSGFFVLGEPGRAATALGVNLLLLAGSVVSYDQHNVPVALLFLVAEAAFYAGGRDAVREESERLNERWLRERREGWLAHSSEPRIMATAFEAKF
jgi:tetratricopeptide (TPR) repeat protein